MDNVRISSILKTYGTYESGLSTSSSKTSRKQGSKDTVALSSQAKDYQSAAKALSSVSDIRQDKIDAIKARMDNGSYSVDTSKLADKMLSNFLL